MKTAQFMSLIFERTEYRRLVKAFGNLTLVAATAIFAVTVQAEELDVETRVALQRTLQAYVDNKTVNDAYSFFDVESGQTSNLKLKKLHPIIFKKEDYFLMCADFMDEKGADVLIDYIVRMGDTSYFVEQEVAGRRGFFKTIFDRVF